MTTGPEVRGSRPILVSFLNFKVTRGVVHKGEKCYIKSVVIIEGSTVHALVFFPAKGTTNPDDF